jgi:hypothetical protein
LPKVPEPLLAQLRLQRNIDAMLRRSLLAADREAQQIITSIAGRGTASVSEILRAEQLRELRQQLVRAQDTLWKSVGADIRVGRTLAATEAARVQGAYEDVLLRAGLSATQRVTYRRTLVAEAQRALRNAASRLQAEVPLSERVYKTQALSKRWVSDRVTQLIAQKTSARGIAKEVSRFIRPDVPGGVSYAAQRLGRTELQNAFHATAVQGYADSPFIVHVEWNLSGSHPRPDLCNDYAERKYDPEQVPSKPHPQCLCYITPETLSPDNFLLQLKSGRFNSYLSDHGVE